MQSTHMGHWTADEALIIPLRARIAGRAQSQRRDIQRGAGSIWREGPAGADCPDGRVHDERDDPPRNGSSGGGRRAALDAALAPGISRETNSLGMRIEPVG